MNSLSRLPGADRSCAAGNGDVAGSGHLARLGGRFSDGGVSAVIDQGIPTRAQDPTEHLDVPRAAVTRYQAS